MEDCKIAIVIPCYNRPIALLRLLKSLEDAVYPTVGINIVFSIDNSGNDDVYEVADSFQWSYGNKRVICHPQNIGLRNNIIYCGDLTNEYDAVIVLEDDLIVATDFINYALQAYQYYKDEPRIGGISLYKYEYCEFGLFRFYPLEFGFDSYFVQWPSSRGQLWTKSQWKLFKVWYSTHDSDLFLFNIPEQAKQWPRSWKKYYAAYLVDTDRYFVYPSVSFTNVFDTVGEHYYLSNTNLDTVSLFQGRDISYDFQNFDGKIVYDSFFQLKNISVEVNGKICNVDMDLYATKQKDNLITDFIISPNYIKNKELKSWGGDNIPFELNVLNNYPGKSFYLYRKNDYSHLKLSPQKKKYLRILLFAPDMIRYLLNAIFGLFIITKKNE